MAQLNKVYTGRLSTTVIMAVVLYLCSLCAYTLMGGNHIIGSMLGTVKVSVELVDSARVDVVGSRTALEELEGVTSAIYIHSAQADNEFSKFIGVDINEFMGQRVLPSSYIVTVDTKYATPENLLKLCNTIKANSWVSDVYYQSDVPVQVGKRISFIKQFVNYIAVLLAFFSLVVLFHAMRISIGAQFNGYGRQQRRMVRKMAYRWAWIQGFLGAVFASAMLYFTLKYAQIILPELPITLDMLPLIGAGAVVGGVILSQLFTSISLLSK